MARLIQWFIYDNRRKYLQYRKKDQIDHVIATNGSIFSPPPTTDHSHYDKTILKQFPTNNWLEETTVFFYFPVQPIDNDPIKQNSYSIHTLHFDNVMPLKTMAKNIAISSIIFLFIYLIIERIFS